MANLNMVRRLQEELKMVSQLSIDGESLDIEMVNDKIDHWQIALPGPKETPYEKGIFLLNLKFESSYPLSPPEVWFSTRIYHPNIDPKEGKVCLVIIKDWQMKNTVKQLLNELLSLLCEPETNDPVNKEAANLYLADQDRYDATVRSWVRKFAMP